MVLSATTIADEPRVLLAFGVGFSYQLGLDDPGSSKRDGVDLGAAGHDAPSAGTSSGCHIGDGNDADGLAETEESRGSSSLGAGESEELRICASVQPTPTAVPLERYLKKGDAPAFASAGANHSVVLTTEGKLFRWGVEDGDVYRVPTGVCTQIPLPCVEVACGRKHTMALMKGGFVMTWGTGYFGQLGHGDNVSYRHPRLLRRLDPQRLGDRIVQVACGGYHSAVVSDAGRVFSWGFNRYGQCGNGSKDNTVPEPSLVDVSDIPLGLIGNAPKILCGRHHSALVVSWGALYTWGACSFGKLGLQDPAKAVCVPQEVTFFSDKPLVQAAAGDFHMVALSRRQEVFSWGYGAEGQGGHGSLLHMRTPRRVSSLQDVPIAQVVCGPWWSMAITVDGYCYSWGCADGGWTGLERPADLSVIDPGPSNDRAVETQSFDSSYNVHVPSLVYSLAPYRVIQVGCGGGHSLVVADRRARSPAPEGSPHAENGLRVGGLPRHTGTPSASAPSLPSAAASAASSSGSPPPSATPSGGPRGQSLSSQDARKAQQPRTASAATAPSPEAGVCAARPEHTASASESGWESGVVEETGSSTMVASGRAGTVRPPSAQDNAAAADYGGGRKAGGVTTEVDTGTPAAASAAVIAVKEKARMAPEEATPSPDRASEDRAAAAAAASAAAAAASRVRKNGSGGGSRAGKNTGGAPGGRGSSGAANGADALGGGSSARTRYGNADAAGVTNGHHHHASPSPSPGPAVASLADGVSCDRSRGHLQPEESVAAAPRAPTAAPETADVVAHSMAPGQAVGDRSGSTGGGASLPVVQGERGTKDRRDRSTSGGGGGEVLEEERLRRRAAGEGKGVKGVAKQGNIWTVSVGEGQGVAGGGREGPREPEYVSKVFSFCRHGRLDQVQKALEAGFDVCGQRDDGGNTLLHCAAQNGLRCMCKALLLREGPGRPLNLKNNLGNTALHYAYAFGFQQLGKYLAVNGADDTLVNDQGLTCYEGLDRQEVEPL